MLHLNQAYIANMIIRLGFLLSLITSGAYSQINPGVYELYFYDNPGETIDSLFNDGRCTYTSYSPNGECVLISIISTREYQDGILYNNSQNTQGRENCNNHIITEIGDNTFEDITEIESVHNVLINLSLNSDQRVKWIKIQEL